MEFAREEALQGKRRNLNIVHPFLKKIYSFGDIFVL